MPDEAKGDIGFAILELMGHRKLAGYVSEDRGLTRIDVYLADESATQEQVDSEDVTGLKHVASQWYGQAAIYCITASTKAHCLEFTRGHQPRPIGRWELPAPADDDGVADVELAEGY